MKKEAMRISFIVPASPHMVYSAWLDSDQHTAFTGSKAVIVPEVGGKFMAGDGYVMGKMVILDLGRRIVQSWRTTEFPRGHADSRLEIHFESVPGGTRVTILHSEIPEGQGERYRSGWNEFYFGPMRTYFGKMAQIADKTSAARLAEIAAHPWVDETEVESAPKKGKTLPPSAPVKSKTAPSAPAPVPVPVPKKSKAPPAPAPVTKGKGPPPPPAKKDAPKKKAAPPPPSAKQAKKPQKAGKAPPKTAKTKAPVKGKSSKSEKKIKAKKPDSGKKKKR